MSIVVQKYGGSSVADVDKHPAGRRARDAHEARRATTSSSWSPRWATRPTSSSRSPSRSRPIRSAASSTCCSPPASGSRWRCCRWRSASWAATPSASPAASRASSPTIATSTRASSRCGPFRVQDELARGKIVVIAGYQGVSYKREVTTLGRGGSDTTAVAMAAALGAEYCEICSDVDGVYTADPRVVPEARRIGTLSYEETQEMAEAGAKVLNAQAVEFAKEKRDRHLRARDRLAAAGRRSVRRRHGRPQVRRRGCRAPSSASRASATCSCCSSQSRRRSAEPPLNCSRCSTSWQSPASNCTRSDGRLTLVISRENLHDEARVRDALAARFGGASPDRWARGRQRRRCRHQRDVRERPARIRSPRAGRARSARQSPRRRSASPGCSSARVWTTACVFSIAHSCSQRASDLLHPERTRAWPRVSSAP